MSGLRRYMPAYLMLLPNFLGIVAFTLFPVLFTLYISFHDWDVFSKPKFVGLANYIHLFTQEPLFWTVLKNTLYYAVLTIPTGLVLALVVAAALNQKVRGIGLFRTALFVPVVASTIAVSVIWRFVFNTDFGILNQFLGLFHIHPIGWLIDERWALPSIALMSLWKGMGFNSLVLLAAMQEVPAILYEAARMDGASSWRSFFAITLPGIAPAIQFVLIMSVINSFQVFDQVYALSNGTGGPGTSTYVYNILIYQNAFRLFKIGYASAMAYVLFGIIFVLTWLQMRLGRNTAAAGEHW